MRYAVNFSFDIEAESHDQATARLKDLKRKISHGAEKLGIGYEAGSMLATPQPPVADQRRRQVTA